MDALIDSRRDKRNFRSMLGLPTHRRGTSLRINLSPAVAFSATAPGTSHSTFGRAATLGLEHGLAQPTPAQQEAFNAFIEQLHNEAKSIVKARKAAGKPVKLVREHAPDKNPTLVVFTFHHPGEEHFSQIDPEAERPRSRQPQVRRPR